MRLSRSLSLVSCSCSLLSCDHYVMVMTQGSEHVYPVIIMLQVVYLSGLGCAPTTLPIHPRTPATIPPQGLPTQCAPPWRQRCAPAAAWSVSPRHVLPPGNTSNYLAFLLPFFGPGFAPPLPLFLLSLGVPLLGLVPGITHPFG